MSCIKLEDNNALNLCTKMLSTKVGIFQVCALVGMCEGRKQTWCNLLQSFKHQQCHPNVGKLDECKLADPFSWNFFFCIKVLH